MKWIGRILYAIMVVIIGAFVLRFAQINALWEYYDENVAPHLIENDRESYMEGFMTANFIEDYLKEPIYLANSNDETYNFEFAIYHLMANNQDESYSYLAFYFNETTFEYEELLASYESYEANNDSAEISIEFKMAGIEDEIKSYFPLNINLRMPVVILEQVRVENNELFKFQVADENNNLIEKTSTEIEKIIITLEDSTAISEEQPNVIKTLIAEFNSDSSNDLSLTDNLVLNDNVLTSNNFNGIALNYALDDLYINEDLLGETDFDTLEDYQSGVGRTVIIYIVIVLVITFLLFFLKPLIKYLDERKAIKARETKLIDQTDKVEKGKEEQIFKD